MGKSFLLKPAAVTLALLLAGAAGAATQGAGGAKGRPQEREGKVGKDQGAPQFDDPSRTAAATAPKPEPVTPAEHFDKAASAATTWPSEAGENSLRALVARGPEMVPIFRAKLKNGTVLERAAAARALCLLADTESFGEIEKLFADPRQRARYVALLASLHELDAGRAQELALRFLASEQAPLRVAATKTLRTNATPELIGSLHDRITTTKSDAVRLDVFDLLLALKDRELPTLALERFLGDDDAPLASRVLALLSWQDDPAIRGELLRLAKSNRERRGLHACLALALAEQRSNHPLLPDELFDELLPKLRTSDPLQRSIACVVCATIGYRSEPRAEATQTQVLPALAEAVVNGRFFGDFEICFQAQVAALELLTGERLGNSIPAWRDYFAKNRGVPLRGQRELKAFVLAEDVPAATVRLARADASGALREQLLLLGPNFRGQVSLGERPGAIALEADEMQNLLVDLERLGLLESELPRTLARPDPGAVEITIDARGRRRSVAGATTDDDGRLAALVARLKAAAEPSLWQLLLPSDDTYARLFAEEAAWFSTHPDPEARRARIIDLALAQIAAGDRDDGNVAFDVLAGLDRLGESARATQIDGIAALLEKMPAADARARKLFDLLVATRRPDALVALLNALVPRGIAARPWLAEAIGKLGAVESALADERPLVRASALLAAERSQLPPDERLAVLATGDPDRAVREKAIDLLAAGGSELAARTLADLARADPKAEPMVRAQALRVMGALRHDSVLEILIGATQDPDSSIAAAALEGLARRGDEAAAAALDGLVRERGVDDTLGKLGLSAIKTLPRKRATAKLQLLMDEGGGNLGREAAYALADLGEMAGAPTLLADLEDPTRHRRAGTLLTYLFCRDFGTEPARFRSLYEVRPGVSHAQYFLEALNEAGTNLPPNLNVPAPEVTALEVVTAPDPEMVPLLVAAIEDARWFIRRSTLEFLESATGLSCGSLPANASKEEIAEMARRWREATATQARGDIPR